MARIQQEFYFGIVPKLVITDLTLINKTTSKHKASNCKCETFLTNGIKSVFVGLLFILQSPCLMAGL